jgi:FMN reductase
MTHSPLIVGIGGTFRPRSSSERALQHALSFASEAGAKTLLLAGKDLVLPLYDPDKSKSKDAARVVDAIRAADGIILSSPCYHGSVSGLLKNVIDYMEETAGDDHPYFEGKAVGSICCGYGEQGLGTVLSHLRSIVHALRGWPVPMGVAINSAAHSFDAEGWMQGKIASQLRIMSHQIVQFADVHRKPCSVVVGEI